MRGESVKLRLLCSCRDPGSALSMAPIIRQFQKSNNVNLKILAENPACKMFISDPQLRSEDILEVKDADPELLSKKVLLIFEDFQPDGVLCGVSGPGSGVDECLLKIAHDVGIRRFTFQDYWGFLNPVSNQCHDMILVVDEYAKELTNARLCCR